MSWLFESGNRREADKDYSIKHGCASPIVLPIKFKFDLEMNAPVVGVLDGFQIDPAKIEMLRKMNIHLAPLKGDRLADSADAFRIKELLSNQRMRAYISNNNGTWPVSTVKIEEVESDDETTGGDPPALGSRILAITDQAIESIVQPMIPDFPSKGMEENQANDHIHRQVLSDLVQSNKRSDKLLRQAQTVRHINHRSKQMAQDRVGVSDAIKHFDHDARKQISDTYLERIDRDAARGLVGPPVQSPIASVPRPLVLSRPSSSVNPSTVARTTTSVPGPLTLSRQPLSVAPPPAARATASAPRPLVLSRPSPPVSLPPVARTTNYPVPVQHRRLAPPERSLQKPEDHRHLAPASASKVTSYTSRSVQPSMSSYTSSSRPTLVVRPRYSAGSVQAVRGMPFVKASANVSVGYPM